MIQKIITYSCPRCGSDQLVKNGHHKANSQQAQCKDCGAYCVLAPKQTLLKTAPERGRLRGLERIFGVTRHTIVTWREPFGQALPHTHQAKKFYVDSNTPLPPSRGESQVRDD